MEIGWINIAFIFVVIWSVVIFMVLPVGVQRDENPEQGHSTGAPKNTQLGMKFLATTLISILLTGVAVVLLKTGFVPIRDVEQ